MYLKNVLEILFIITIKLARHGGINYMTPFEKLEKVTELLTYNSQTPFLLMNEMGENQLSPPK